MDNYTSDSSDSEVTNKTVDFSHLLFDNELVERNLDALADDTKKSSDIERIILDHNQLTCLPDNIGKFSNVRVLDISNNGLKTLPDIFKYCSLTNLVAKNNFLQNDSLPKCFTNCETLRELNLSGNMLSQFPEQILDFVNLRYLYLGGNSMQNISKNIWKLSNLQIASFGGNNLVEVPATLGQLVHLNALVLCDNQIQSLPADIANIRNLKSLLLHKNKLKTLPQEIVALKHLSELSLRDNPLVVRFVSDMTYSPASLLELSARSIKLYNLKVKFGDIPTRLFEYLRCAQRCVNPNCKGVFFDSRVEHIKFVDFCGKYRLPLLQYLCSSKCADPGGDESVRPTRSYLTKKVLLG